MDLATPKFEIREDEEQFQKLQDCVDLLIAAGYFRARVKGLSSFDRVVGGIVWCISTCNYSVDVDLLYSENSTIGQKIALTEKIVNVLTQLKCPFSIEPHQVQGLDMIHIFPVIQWLVRKAVEAKEMYGDRNQAFADYLYQSHSDGKRDMATTSNSVLELCRNDVKPRLFRRTADTATSSLRDDVRCTMSEYGEKAAVHESAETSENKEVGDDDDNKLESATGRSKASGKALRQLINASDIEKLANVIQATTEKSQETEEDLDCHIEELNAEFEQLRVELKKEEDKLKALREEQENVEQKCNELDALEAGLDPSELENLRQLFTDYVSVAEREGTFKRKCNEEMEQLDAEIERLETAGNDYETDEYKQAKVDLQRAEEELLESRQRNAEVSREVARLQRRIDSVPSQIEVAQYHKRLIELYNQMGSKHRQTRQYYVLHNSLVDMRNFLKKETELLNNIEEALPMAKTDANRESFLQQLQTIARSVETNVEKLQLRERELEAKNELLNVEYGFQRDKERAFQKALDDFKQECEEVERLQARLLEFGVVDDL